MLMADYFRKATSAREGIASRYSDLLLVVAIIAIVAMMVLPLPAWLINVLVAINIAVGVILLLLGVYIASPLEFSAFPSVLLLTTLFRLSVSIATTRMILLHGEGGHIIDTFGKTVAGGNLVVGLVVFLIITVVQFIVIAKGAERVAEVAARFSLDAMPGKQLSIDSDLRSGLIDKDEAKRSAAAVEPTRAGRNTAKSESAASPDRSVVFSSVVLVKPFIGDSFYLLPTSRAALPRAAAAPPSMPDRSRPGWFPPSQTRPRYRENRSRRGDRSPSDRRRADSW